MLHFHFRWLLLGLVRVSVLVVAVILFDVYAVRVAINVRVTFALPPGLVSIGVQI
jgi:hypothetical protein